MRDEMDARIWAEHGAAFSEDLDKLLRRVWAGLKRLHQIEFDAPWLHERRRGVTD